MSIIDYGDFNIWKCDLCHSTIVLAKAYKPEGWIEPKIVLAEMDQEILMPTAICNVCRMSIISTPPHNLKLIAKEVFCNKDHLYKFCDTDDKVIAFSTNRVDWTYLKHDEPTCYCSPSCEFYPKEEEIEEDQTKLLDIVNLTCALCGELTFTTPDVLPEGWIRLNIPNIHNPTQPAVKLICKSCISVLPYQNHCQDNQK